MVFFVLHCINVPSLKLINTINPDQWAVSRKFATELQAAWGHLTVLCLWQPVWGCLLYKCQMFICDMEALQNLSDGICLSNQIFHLKWLTSHFRRQQAQHRNRIQKDSHRRNSFGRFTGDAQSLTLVHLVLFLNIFFSSNLKMHSREKSKKIHSQGIHLDASQVTLSLWQSTWQIFRLKKSFFETI